MLPIRKYVRTPHLAGSNLQPGDTTDGQVPFESLVEGTLVVEEKLDGANSGISFDPEANMILQCRGHQLLGGPREKQFDLFKQWAAFHEDRFFDLLGARYIMYGEWLFAKHSVFYDRLPHYFFEFDIFDKEREIFLDTPSRHALLAGSPVISVPVLEHKGLRSIKDAKALIKPSLYKSERWQEALTEAARRAKQPIDRVMIETNQSDLSEGLYIKQELDGETIGRFKFVRADFTQTILDSGTHWADRPIIPNALAEGVDLFV